MRLVGEIEELANARTFSDYLTQLGIKNQVIEEPGGDKIAHEIWVQEEDKVEEAEGLLKKFLENPGDEQYQGVSKIARKIKKQAEKEAKQGPQYMDARTTIFHRGVPRSGVLTLLIVLTCVVVSVLSKLGENTSAMKMLFITEYWREGAIIYWKKGLPEIMNWQLWRLFTPMFIHYGIIHLVFNMMWLWDLGNMVEDRKGTLFLAIFILFVSGSSNWAQYQVSGPGFGGMSGVVYGLLGYIWMKGKYDPGSRLALHKTTVAMMIGWYFLCLSGLVGHIANMAHTVGLVVGIAWGYLTSGHFKRQLRKFGEKNGG
jgi:GlpG protein